MTSERRPSPPPSPTSLARIRAFQERQFSSRERSPHRDLFLIFGVVLCLAGVWSVAGGGSSSAPLLNRTSSTSSASTNLLDPEFEPLGFLERHWFRWYARGGEDAFLFEHFFRNQREGAFLEVGARDGLHGSVTKTLAAFRNWRGVLVETDAEWAEALRRSRASCHATPVRAVFGSACAAATAAAARAPSTSSARALPCLDLDATLSSLGFHELDLLVLRAGAPLAELVGTVDSLPWDRRPVRVVVAPHVSADSDPYAPVAHVLAERGLHLLSAHVGDHAVWVHPRFFSLGGGSLRPHRTCDAAGGASCAGSNPRTPLLVAIAALLGVVGGVLYAYAGRSGSRAHHPPPLTPKKKD